MPKYARFDYENYTFVFKFDDDSPDLLHIWARHLKTEADALRIWLEGTDKWNAKYQRYETYTDSEGVYWIWLKPDKVVMIISCFDI